MAKTKITSNVLAANAAQNNLNAGSSISLTKAVSLSGNLTVDTNVLVVDSISNRVGIGTITPNERLTVSGNLSASGIAYAGGSKLAAETFAIAMAIAVG
jgi:hypothetical protein